MTLELTNTVANNAEAINSVAISRNDLNAKIAEMLKAAFREDAQSGWYLYLLCDIETSELLISEPARNNTYFSENYIELCKVEQFYIDYTSTDFAYDFELNFEAYTNCEIYNALEIIEEEVEQKIYAIEARYKIDLQIN